MSNKPMKINDLNGIIEEKGKKVLEKFGQASIHGVFQPELLSILEEIKAYWKDSYRPALTSICCEAVGGQPEMTDDISLMITLASAGGGLHDDIIDKSLNKHFRKTILGRYGIETSLVIGDLLILKSWTMLPAAIKKTWRPQKIIDVINAYGSWTVEVCESEFMETLCRHNLDNELDYYQKILWMSMADTEACARLGAIIGDGSKEEILALAEFGRRLGFMFRIADDVKDTFNIEGNLPNRLKFESVPLPLLYSAKSSRKTYFEIKSILEKPHIAALEISELLGFCFDANAFTYVYDIAKQNEMRAAQKLCLVKPSNARETLSLMIKKPYADIAKLCC